MLVKILLITSIVCSIILSLQPQPTTPINPDPALPAEIPTQPHKSTPLIINPRNHDYEYLALINGSTTITHIHCTNRKIGIAIFSDNNRIKNCLFTNCTDEGVFIGGTHNTIENCTFIGCCDGIELRFATHNQILNCTFLNNTHAAIDILPHTNHTQIHYCVFRNNPYGIICNKGYQTRETNNEFLKSPLNLERCTNT